jgi:chemotaxis protein MotB
MAEAKEDESKVRWLVSYADFMMQLLCCFVLLFSVSSLDVEMLSKVAAGYREHKGLGAPSIMNPEQGRFFPLDKSRWPKVERGVRTYGTDKYRKLIKFVNLEEGVLLFFEGIKLFEEGSHQLTQEAKNVLNVIRWDLQVYPNQVEITGHTSSRPQDSIKGDHWLLSLLRAKNVANFLSGEPGNYFIHPARIIVQGRAHYQPLKDERDPEIREEARIANRRVDLLVVGLWREGPRVLTQAGQY